MLMTIDLSKINVKVPAKIDLSKLSVNVGGTTSTSKPTTTTSKVLAKSPTMNRTGIAAIDKGGAAQKAMVDKANADYLATLKKGGVTGNVASIAHNLIMTQAGADNYWIDPLQLAQQNQAVIKQNPRAVQSGNVPLAGVQNTTYNKPIYNPNATPEIAQAEEALKHNTHSVQRDITNRAGLKATNPHWNADFTTQQATDIMSGFLAPTSFVKVLDAPEKAMALFAKVTGKTAVELGATVEDVAKIVTDTTHPSNKIVTDVLHKNLKEAIDNDKDLQSIGTKEKASTKTTPSTEAPTNSLKKPDSNLTTAERKAEIVDLKNTKEFHETKDLKSSEMTKGQTRKEIADIDKAIKYHEDKLKEIKTYDKVIAKEEVANTERVKAQAEQDKLLAIETAKKEVADAKVAHESSIAKVEKLRKQNYGDTFSKDAIAAQNEAKARLNSAKSALSKLNKEAKVTPIEEVAAKKVRSGKEVRTTNYDKARLREATIKADKANNALADALRRRAELHSQSTIAKVGREGTQDQHLANIKQNDIDIRHYAEQARPARENLNALKSEIEKSHYTPLEAAIKEKEEAAINVTEVAQETQSLRNRGDAVTATKLEEEAGQRLRDADKKVNIEKAKELKTKEKEAPREKTVRNENTSENASTNEPNIVHTESGDVKLDSDGNITKDSYKDINEKIIKDTVREYPEGKGEKAKNSIYENFLNSKYTSDKVKEIIDKMSPLDKEHLRLTNEQTMEKVRHILSLGLQHAIDDIEKAIATDRLGQAYQPPLIRILSNILTEAGDVSKAQYFMSALAESMLRKGQFIQAASLGAASSPEVMLRAMESWVAGIQRESDIAAEVGLKHLVKFAEQVTRKSGVGIKIVKGLEYGANGKYENGVIYLNQYAPHSELYTLIHETTHLIEKSGKYEDLAKFIEDHARAMGDDVDKMKSIIAREYYSKGIKLTKEGIDQEFIAKASEKYLFTDRSALKKLYGVRPDLGDVIHNSLKAIISKLPEKLWGAEQLSAKKFIESAEKLYKQAFEDAKAENLKNATEMKDIYTKPQYSLSPVTQEVQVNGTKTVMKTYEVSIQPEVLAKFKDITPEHILSTFEEAEFAQTNPTRISDWNEIYSKAEIMSDWSNVKKQGAGKLDNVPIVSLTKGCQRTLSTIERVKNGILPSATRVEACYGGDCWVNKQFNRGFSSFENMEVRDLKMADASKFDSWLSKPTTKAFINQGDFIRHGQQGDDSHLFASGIALKWLESCKKNGITKKNVFITAGYAPVTAKQYAELAKYSDIFEIHFSNSGWFHQNEIMIRLNEFKKAREAGVPSTIRLITNKDNISGLEMVNEDFLYAKMKELDVKQEQVLETPFHDDALKQSKKQDRSEPSGLFKNVCCETGKCNTCTKGCMVKINRLYDTVKPELLKYRDGGELPTIDSVVNAPEKGVAAIAKKEEVPVTEKNASQLSIGSAYDEIKAEYKGEKAQAPKSPKGYLKVKASWARYGLTEQEKLEIRSTKADNVDAVAALYHKIGLRVAEDYRASNFEKFDELRRISMLLNIKTQVRNIAGNAPILVERIAANKLSSILQEAAIRTGAMDREDKTQAFKVTKESYAIADKYFNEVAKQHLALSQKYGNETHPIEALHNAERRVFRHQGKVVNIKNPLKKGSSYDLELSLEGLRRLTYKALEKGDAPYLKWAYTQRLASYIEAKGWKSIEDVTEEAFHESAMEALKATYRDASYISTSLNRYKMKGTIGSKVLEGIMPFTTTPINLVRRTFDYSPVGIVKSLFMAKNGDDFAKAIDEFSKGLVGTGVLYGGFLLAQSHLIFGEAPLNPDQAAYYKSIGIQPYSVNTPFGTITFDWGQPVSGQFAAGAAMYEALKKSEGHLTFTGWLKLAAEMGFAGANSIINTSVWQNIVNLFNGTYGGSGTIQSILSGALSYPTQSFPSGVGQLAKVLDPNIKVSYDPTSPTKTFINQNLLAKTPILESQLATKPDSWGRPMTRLQNPVARVAQEFIDPANFALKNERKRDREIMKLYKKTGSTKVFPSKAPYYIEVKNRAGDNVKVDFTPQQWAKYQTVMGKYAAKEVNKLINSPQWNLLRTVKAGANGKNAQAEALNKIYVEASKVAKADYESRHRPK